jgi:hypothetical protein
MITLNEILGGIVLPIAIGLVVMLALSRRKRLGATLALGLGFTAGYAVLAHAGGANVLRPADQFHWIWWAVVAALAWGLLDSATRLPTPARAAVLLAAGLAISATLLWPLTRSEWQGPTAYAWLAGVGLGIAILWASLDAVSDRTPGPAVATVYLLAAAVLAITLGATGSVAFAKLAGALAATAAGLWLAALLRHRESTPWMARGATAVFAVAYLGMIVNGHFWSNLPWPDATLLAVAPCALWVGHLTPTRWPTWKRHTAGIAAATVILLTAVGLAGYAGYKATQNPDPASMYGYSAARHVSQAPLLRLT